MQASQHYLFSVINIILFNVMIDKQMLLLKPSPNRYVL